jgi:hypothetical protein
MREHERLAVPSVGANRGPLKAPLVIDEFERADARDGVGGCAAVDQQRTGSEHL